MSGTAEMMDLSRVKLEPGMKKVTIKKSTEVLKAPEVPKEDEVKVVHRIPAYLSKDFAGKLFLVQQPLRPATNNLEPQSFTKVKYKPKLKKFQFTVSLDTNSEFYDKHKGENMAANAANTSGDEMVDLTDERSRPKIDNVTLEGTSVPLPSGSSRYVIGIVKKDQIHLCPLEGIIQVKPTFPYLNKAEKKKAEASADTETEEEEEATKVTVRFSRNNNRDPNAKEESRRPKSFSVVKKLEEEEPWITKEYRDYTPSNVEKLYSKNINSELSYYPANQKEYLEQLFPKFDMNMEGTVDKKKIASGRVSITQLKQMTLADQVRVLMTNGKVLHYGQIEEFLRTKLKVTVDDDSLIRVIQTVAVLVQGCWVVRSDVVYPVDNASASNKASQTVLQQARDLILSKFTDNRIQERKKLCTLTHLPVEQVTEILSQIARKVVKQGWDFLLPFDNDFTKKFPDTVQRQASMWEMKNRQKIRHPSTSDYRGGEQTSRAAGGRSRTKSISSDTDSGAESEGRAGRRGGRQRRLSSRSDVGIPSRVEP